MLYFIVSQAYLQNSHTTFLVISYVADGRKIANQVRGIGVAPTELPEWKKQVMGGAKASFGKKETRSILEQRSSLPIAKLKDELLKVSKDIIELIT